VDKDVVDVTFAIQPSGAAGFTRVRQALASFTLHYNVRTEKFASGTASPAVDVSLSAQ
jgi:hypothetical protein